MNQYTSPERFQNHDVRTELGDAIDALQTQLLWKGEAYVETTHDGFAPVLEPAEGADYDVVVGQIEVDEPDPNARPQDGRYPNMRYTVTINQDSRVLKNHGLWTTLEKSAGIVDGRSRSIAYHVYETGETFRSVIDTASSGEREIIEQNTVLNVTETTAITKQLQNIVEVEPPHNAR